jgi:hypothetical protein
MIHMPQAGRVLIVAAAICVFAVAVTACVADDKEEEVPLDKVPKAVLAAVRKKFPDAKLQGAAKQTEDELVFYEVLVRHKGHELYVVCEPEGKIVEIDREISVKDLPKPVAEALKKKFAKAGIISVEEVTEDDEITYAVILKHNKKTLHVLFDPKGKVLEEEPFDEKK